MRLLFSDGELLRRGGLVYLIHSDNGCHVVGQGFVCAVDGTKEGLDLIAKLKATARRRGTVIVASLRCDSPQHDKWYGCHG